MPQAIEERYDATKSSLFRYLLLSEETQKEFRRLEKQLFGLTSERQRNHILLQLAALTVDHAPDSASGYLKLLRGSERVMRDHEPASRAILSLVAARQSGLIRAELPPNPAIPVSISGSESDELQWQTMQLEIGLTLHSGDHARVVQNFEKAMAAPRGQRFSMSTETFQDYQRALEALGNATKIYPLLEQVAARSPHSAEGRWAIVQLVSCDNPSITKQGAYLPSRRFLIQLYRAAIDPGLREYIKARINLPVRDERGLSYVMNDLDRMSFLFEAGDYAAVRAEFGRHQGIALVEGAAHFYELAARAEWRMGMRHEAAQHLSQAIAAQNNSTRRRTLRVWLADLLAEMRMHIPAREAYLTLMSESPSQRLRWDIFWNSYLGRDLSRADQLLSKSSGAAIRDGHGDELRLYWGARIAELQGNGAVLAERVAQLLDRYPSSYYSVMAQVKWPIFSGAARSQDWSGESVWSRKSRLLPLTEQVESRDWAQENPSDELENSNDSQTYLNLGAAASGRLDANRLLSLEEGASLERLLAEAAVASGVAVELISSIMQVESGFRPYVVSPVGASGLMQIMPKTGALIANNLGDGSYAEKFLFNPSRNVAYGAYYLRFLLEYYRGVMPLAIAAYNAGPAAVDRWLARCRDCEIDEFVEWIPYRETRLYVKNVLRHFSRRVGSSEKVLEKLTGLELPTDLPAFQEVF